MQWVAEECPGRKSKKMKRRYLPQHAAIMRMATHADARRRYFPNAITWADVKSCWSDLGMSTRVAMLTQWSHFQCHRALWGRKHNLAVRWPGATATPTSPTMQGTSLSSLWTHQPILLDADPRLPKMSETRLLRCFKVGLAAARASASEAFGWVAARGRAPAPRFRRVASSRAAYGLREYPFDMRYPGERSQAYLGTVCM